MNHLYTEKDLKNANKLGKTYISFQYIDGRSAINECSGNVNMIFDYLCNAFAGLMCRIDIQTTAEDLSEKFRKRILTLYYEHKDDVNKC